MEFFLRSNNNLIKIAVYILFIALIIGILFCILTNVRNSSFTIKNNTEVNISYLSIKITNSHISINIPTLKPNDIFVTNLKLPKDFVEGSIILTYTDKIGQQHNEYIEGYIERNYKNDVEILIDKVLYDGVLSFIISK